MTSVWRCRLTLPSLLLTTFSGRSGVFAKQVNDKAFAPEHRPIATEDIERHLKGETGLGYYLLREDSTVTGCCIDVDDKGRNDQALIQAQQMCRAYDDCGVPCCMEVSQSGEGAHVWTFFEAPIPAADARKFMRGVLAYASLQAKEIYPRQDRLEPDKPLGNLMRYPLWNKSRFVSPDTLQTLDPETTLRGLQRVTPDRFTQCMELWETYLTDHVVENYDAYGTDGLPPRVHQLLEAGGSSLLFKRWHGDTSGLTDSSKSGIVYGIAVQLVRAMVPTPEIEAALRYWCTTRSYDKGQEAKWIARTVCRAYNAAAGIRERREINGRDLFALAANYIDVIGREEEILIPSGVKGLDQAIGGVALGEWCVFAARPGQLKSTFAMHWQSTAAQHGHSSLLVQLEMSTKQVSKKVCIQAGVDISLLNTPEGAARAHEAVKRYFKSREKCLFESGCNQIDRLEETVRFYAEQYGVRFVVIDHQGYLWWRRESEYVDQTYIAKQVKKLAKDLDIAIISLVHLRRPDSAAAKGGRANVPTLDHLRASGEIEQSADVVVGAWWPYTQSKAAPKEDYFLYPLKCRDRDFDSEPFKVRAITHEQRFE